MFMLVISVKHRLIDFNRRLARTNKQIKFPYWQPICETKIHYEKGPNLLLCFI